MLLLRAKVKIDNVEFPLRNLFLSILFQKIGFLADGSNVHAELKRLEKSVYLWQCRILQCEMDILHQKEILVQTQIQTRKREIDGKGKFLHVSVNLNYLFNMNIYIYIRIF